MSWISLLLQLLTLRRSFHESRSMVDAAREYAERGKRALASVLLMLLAALFLFSALLIAVVELGLEIDRGAGIQYSGLMISSTILCVISFGFLLAGWLVGRSPPAPPPPPPPPNPRAERLKDVLEEFLVGFISQLSKPSGEKPRAD